MIEKNTPIIACIFLLALLSCSESNLGTAELSEQIPAEDFTLQNQKVMKDSPENVSAAFFEMVEEVQKMSRK